MTCTSYKIKFEPLLSKYTIIDFLIVHDEYEGCHMSILTYKDTSDDWHTLGYHLPRLGGRYANTLYLEYPSWMHKCPQLYCEESVYGVSYNVF